MLEGLERIISQVVAEGAVMDSPIRMEISNNSQKPITGNVCFLTIVIG